MNTELYILSLLAGLVYGGNIPNFLLKDGTQGNNKSFSRYNDTVYVHRRSGTKIAYLRFSNFSGERKNLIIFDRCFLCLLNSDIILFTKIHITDFFFF